MSRPKKPRIPDGALLPIVVTDQWLAAVTAASWWCQCQRLYQPLDPKCTHTMPCDHTGSGPGAYRLIVDVSGLVLCQPCATKRANTRKNQAKKDAVAAMAMAQPSLYDLLDETGEAR